MSGERRRVVLVSGLSGGGKSSALRELEDLGYEAVDNAPLAMLDDLVARSERKLAIGVDTRTSGFDADLVLQAMDRLRTNPALRPELVFAWADETTLLRRYTETRRRHPLAAQGRVADGIAREELLTAPLREGADLVIDTSELPLASLRRLIDRHFGAGSDAEESRLVVSLISFAYKHGLPRKQIWYSMHAFCGIPTTTPCCSLGRDWTPRSAPSLRRTRTSRHSLSRWLA